MTKNSSSSRAPQLRLALTSGTTRGARKMAQNAQKIPSPAAITSTAQSQNPTSLHDHRDDHNRRTAPAAPPNHHDFFHDLWYETPRSAQLNHFRDFLHNLWHETPQTTSCTTGTSTTCRETRKTCLCMITETSTTPQSCTCGTSTAGTPCAAVCSVCSHQQRWPPTARKTSKGKATLVNLNACCCCCCCLVVGCFFLLFVVVEWLYFSKRKIVVRWADLSDFFR